MRLARSLLVALLFSSLAPSIGRADDQEIAKGHFSTGLSYYGSGEYGPAVKEFLEAWRLIKSADLLFNIALTYEKLDDPGRATIYYQRFLAARPDAVERAEVETKVAKLASRVARLTVLSSPGSQIVVDGEALGRAPVAPLVVSQGKHRVEAQRDGFVTAAVEVELAGSEAREIRVVPLDGVAVPAREGPVAVKSVASAPPAPIVATPVAVATTTPAPSAGEVPARAPARERDWRELDEGSTADSTADRAATPAPETSDGAALYRAPDRPEDKLKPHRRVWPVVLAVVLGVVVAAGVATTLALTLGGSDYASNARAACTGNCVLFDMNGFR